MRTVNMSSAMIVASLIGLLSVAVCWPRVRDSTLVGPWIWSIAFFATLSLMLMFGLASEPSISARYAMTCLSFCPAVALLGAKRPQHQMWHFVVATFAGMMVLPSFEVLILQPGQALEVQDLRGWFLWAIVLGCWINRWGTRQFLAGTLFFAAQVLALAPVLPLWKSSANYWPAAIGLWTLAAIAEALLSRPRGHIVHRWDALWLDFRDRFGVVWAARVRERVNTVAQSQDWNLELGWQGFRPISIEDPNAATEAEIWNTDRAQKLVIVFANVLRRFLSPDELEHRAKELLDAEPPIEV